MIADAVPFIILDCVDSTNNYAMAQLHTGKALHGNAYFANEQRIGRGRRGKSWQTQKGKNIMLSIVFNTEFLPVYQQFQLSISTSLGCLDFFHRYTTNNVKIKWPNDLYWNDRKAGGILIDNIIKGDLWQWAVIGIGININQTSFSANLPNPISLKQITGETYDIVKSAKELYEDVMTRFDDLRKNQFENLYSLYNQSLYRLKEQIKLKKDNIVFNTTLIGVAPQGQLITKDVIERNFDFDEVEWVL
jgi:BirA family transcriptional regulator, biotin operon repressor / biotin---[acetyl-CoA-carboxylase] ligase